MEVKHLPMSVKMTEEPGTFEAVVSVFGNEDSYGDIMQPGAFTKTLAAWKESGRLIPVLWMHDAHQVPIGGVTEARETDEGLQVKASLTLGIPRAAEVHEAMKAGTLAEFSFGYYEVAAREVTQDGKTVRLVDEVDLFEVSAVFRGANPATRLVDVKSDLSHNAEDPNSGNAEDGYPVADARRRLWLT